MKILVTGKTGVGKTTLLNALNLPSIYQADFFVKNVLYKNPHPVYKFIAKKYPEVIEQGQIKTYLLGPILFNDQQKMEEINVLIAPYVRKWIEDLPSRSIVEMAGYINNQDKYQNIFDCIILIKRKHANTSEKFAYLSKKVQPIKDIKIKSDYIIKNNHYLDDAIIKLRQIIRKQIKKNNK